LVSVYDEDTNKDTLINKKDLRRFYHFDAKVSVKTQIIPPNYSVIRSQYDSKNDLMYIFASLDEIKNGTQEKTESIHIFWFSLKNLRERNYYIDYLRLEVADFTTIINNKSQN
jgi:hypothetical protein